MYFLFIWHIFHPLEVARRGMMEKTFFVEAGTLFEMPGV